MRHDAGSSGCCRSVLKSVPRLLFVDDDPMLLRSLGRLFARDRGRWDMTFAGSGRQGIDVIESVAIDLLVTDLHMPDIAGTEVLAAAKRCSPDAPRILLTGRPDAAIGLDAHLVFAKDRIIELRDVVAGLLAGWTSRHRMVN